MKKIIFLHLLLFFAFYQAKADTEIKLGNYTFYVPTNATLYYEDRPAFFSWSVGGNVTGPISIELTLESKQGNIALFQSNSSTKCYSSWHGENAIVPKAEGEVSLKVKITENNVVRHNTTLRNYKIEYRTLYGISGANRVYIGEKSTFTLNNVQNVKSTKWSLSNSSLGSLESQQLRTVVLNPLRAGAIELFAEITLVTGDKKTARRSFNILEHPLKNLTISGDSKIISCGQDVKYKLTGIPDGSTITWSIDNASAKIKAGQGTKEVSIAIDDISNFILSAMVESGELKKTVTKNISVSYPEIEGESEFFSFGQAEDLKYKLTEVPDGAKITWSTNLSKVTIIPEKNGQEVTLKGVTSGFTLEAKIEINGIQKLISKRVSNITLSSTGPKLVKLGETFVCKLKNYDKLKEKYPKVKIEWGIEMFLNKNLEQPIVSVVSEINDLGEMSFICNESGLVTLFPVVDIDNKKYPLNDYGRWLKINMGDMCMVQVPISDEFEGGCGVYLLNIPSDVNREKIEWSKVNEEYDKYDIFDPVLGNDGDLWAGALRCQIAMLIETSRTDKARVRARVHFEDGTYKDIISPILTEWNNPPLNSSFMAVDIPIITPQTSSEKIYSVEVFTLNRGYKVHAEKNVINFDINNLNISKGVYIVRMTDEEGNITTSKMLKK